jgi:hypothetical protein
MDAKLVKRLILLPVVLTLCQCDKVKAVVKPKPAAPTPYDFHLALEFTPAAAEKMKAARDDIVISTFYYGHARPEYLAKADDLRRIELGYKQVAFANTARNVTINSSAMDTRLLPQTTEGEPYVLITVSSAAPQGYPDLLIECRTYTGPVKALQNQMHALTCDLARA